jgi:predicted polyphosphate/ATP-dependent NAD kinase
MASIGEVEEKRRLGLIVNPIAGMGGRVGLKGTDSMEIVREAVRLGGVPESPGRAITALRQLFTAAGDGIELLAAPGRMGEDEAIESGFRPIAIGVAGGGDSTGETSASDTRRAAEAMVAAGVDLILFAGGDGTARDIYSAVGDAVPVVGIPAGVKMHSAVYATNPRAAANLVEKFLANPDLPLRELEVMDIDEDAFRQGSVSASLYGYMRVPYERHLIQGAKSGSEPSDESAAMAVAREMARRVTPGHLYVLGPGTTLRGIGRELGVEKTLLGVDLYKDGEIIARDVTAAQVARAVGDNEGHTSIVVTPIGGQGHIFGRGNQQISPSVIREAGKDAIVVVATTNKLAALRGRPLLVDTGDPEVDDMLSGYIRVVTGINMESVYRVSA